MNIYSSFGHHLAAVGAFEAQLMEHLAVAVDPFALVYGLAARVALFAASAPSGRWF